MYDRELFTARLHGSSKFSWVILCNKQPVARSYREYDTRDEAADAGLATMVKLDMTVTLDNGGDADDEY